MSKDNPSPISLLQYSLFAAPVAFAGFPLYVLAPDFYATNYNISLTYLGIILLLLRLFDAFQDPFIGFMSDRFRKHSKYYISASAIILCASIYGLFNIMYISPIFWFLLCMGLAITAYSVLSINLNALGALWTDNKNAQTQIASYREAFALLGLVLAVSLPSILSKSYSKEQVYIVFALLLTILMFFALVLFVRWIGLARISNQKSKSETYSFFTVFRSLSSDSKRLLTVYLISMIASSIPAVLVLFFVRDRLLAEQYTGLFLMLYFVSGALFIPMWKRLSTYYGKHKTWFYSMILAIVSFIWAFFLGEGDIIQYAIICIASGAALGADLIFPPSILADELHINHSEDNASSHYSLLTLIAKSSLAIASVIALPAIELFGFVPESVNDYTALTALNAMYAMVPCFLKAISAAMIFYFYINQPKLESYNEKNKTNSNDWSVNDV